MREISPAAGPVRIVASIILFLITYSSRYSRLSKLSFALADALRLAHNDLRDNVDFGISKSKGHSVTKNLLPEG